MRIKRLLRPTLLYMLFSLAIISAMAQSKILKGTITDDKNAPLPGASVTVKGTNMSTAANATGIFTLNVPATAKTLVVSSVGFTTQEVSIAGKTDITISLLSANITNDVVVIGLRHRSQKEVTGSIATVTAKDFQQGNITTPEQLIAGKVAGVSITSNGGSPGAGSTIRIRGGASLNASNDPLIVIDGVPLAPSNIYGVSNSLSLINPNDIASFTILKDAAATAIYGSRASNGVI